MKSNQLSNQLGIFLLVGILAAVATFFGIKPATHSAGTSNTQIKNTQAQITGLKNLSKETDQLRQNYASVSSKRNQILNQLPPQSQEERLLALLSQFGSQTGVSLTAFTPVASTSGGTAAPSSIAIYPASVNISGSYPQIQQFLSQIEHGARFLDVTSIAMSSGSNSNALTAVVTFQAYYQANDNAGGSNG